MPAPFVKTLYSSAKKNVPAGNQVINANMWELSQEQPDSAWFCEITTAFSFSLASLEKIHFAKFFILMSH